MRGRLAGVLVGAAVLAAASPGVAGAETFRVTRTTDANGMCDDRCSLREAVIAAEENLGDDKVKLPEGRHELTIGGPGDDFGEEGDLDIGGPDAVTLVGAGMKETVIDANRIDRAMNVFALADLVVRDLTITGGKAKQGYEGGGLIVESDGAATLVRTKVSGNSTSESVADGAGMYLFDGASVTLKRTVVSGNVNRAGDGGGIENRGDLEVIWSTIANNRALESDGGGISMNGADSLRLEASTVSGNRAGGPDGGGDGGGIYAPGNTTATTIINSTISGNAARGPSSQGGGLLTVGTVDVTNATIAYNSSGSDEAGGIWGNTGADIRLFNTIVARNDGSAGTENCGGNPATYDSQGHNLEDLDTCELDGPSDQTGVDPMLKPLADNGGPTRTHALRPGSDAIDTANLIGCPDRDQRGVNRPRGPTCDIGAFERRP